MNFLSRSACAIRTLLDGADPIGIGASCLAASPSARCAVTWAHAHSSAVFSRLIARRVEGKPLVVVDQWRRNRALDRHGINIGAGRNSGLATQEDTGRRPGLIPRWLSRDDGPDPKELQERCRLAAGWVGFPARRSPPRGTRIIPVAAPVELGCRSRRAIQGPVLELI